MTQIKREELMTIGELKEKLGGYSDDTKVIFECKSLTLYRLQLRGDKLLQFEFKQNVFDDENGKVYIHNIE